MGIAASPFPNPVTGDAKIAAHALSSRRRAQRAKQRREMMGMIGISYIIDGLILLVYAYDGLIPVALAASFSACGLTTTAFYIALSESGFNDRFKDHYVVLPQALTSLATVLVFSYIAPQVGILFLCGLFIVFSFSSLRSTARETAIAWTAMACGVAGLFLMNERPISMPNATHIQRFGTMLVFTLTIGRCMFLGIFASSLRESLYKRGLQLREAYKRIEELAELDELTGSFNRRSIMRMLDDEISRAQRNRNPLSVALIDLDWFKRINDAFGHPTGDEVLRTFAITVFANIRTIDRFGRYGGEEFLLVLPDTPNDEAVATLDRLRTIIAGLDWSAFSPEMNLTISAGIATLLPNETPDAILARVDSALYVAKRGGRNRVAAA